MKFAGLQLCDLPEEYKDALFKAADRDFETLHDLLERADSNCLLCSRGKGNCLATKLIFLAIGKGDRDIVQVLLKKGAKVNSSCCGQSLLSRALSLGYWDIAMLLLENGAMANQLNRKEEGPLFAAIESPVLRNKENVIETLINTGADPNQISLAGKKPIHVAAAHCPYAIKALARAGCDVNAQDSIHRDTPLHVACNRCRADCVLSLLQVGAKLNFVNAFGETPLEKVLKFAVDSHSFHAKFRKELGRTLIKLGFRVYAQNTEVGRRNKMKKVYDDLMKESNVSTLQNLCRPVVVNLLPDAGVSKCLRELSIPVNLKTFIGFEYECL